MRRYNKNFRFADEIVSGDAIISAILGIISIIATLITVIYVVSVKGMASSKVGAILLASLVAGITGLVFAILTIRANAGSSRSRRVVLTINIIAVLLIVGIWVCRIF